LSHKDRYVFTDNFGTSEEKYLVKFIDKAYDQLKKKYSQIFWVCNDRLKALLYGRNDATKISGRSPLFHPFSGSITALTYLTALLLIDNHCQEARWRNPASLNHQRIRIT